MIGISWQHQVTTKLLGFLLGVKGERQCLIQNWKANIKQYNYLISVFHCLLHMCFPAAMVVLTRTPSVEVGFLKEPNLHCQFSVDHKLPNATVEWRLQKHGERSKLFSYSSRTGKSDGSGVAIKAIAAGNASYKLPPTKKISEGTYVCSVMVPPLFGSHDIPLTLSGKITHFTIHIYVCFLFLFFF